MSIMGCSTGDCFKHGPAVAWWVTAFTPSSPRSPGFVQPVLLALNTAQSTLSSPCSASPPVAWREGESTASRGRMLLALQCARVQRGLQSTALLLMSSLQSPKARLLVEVDEDHLGKKHSPYKVLQVHRCCRYVSCLCDLL